MIRPLALAVVFLAPLAVAVPGNLAAEVEPAWATTPTTTDTSGSGTTVDASTGDATGTTGGAGDSDATSDTATMPPVYEACGCASAGEAGGWAALALLFTSGSRCRRRRPTR
ncbi:hypothetical protein [Nannocystis sp. SCPEA4]|uniref:hypothetical protein n=1 Tax=Nannocystis sp. SCPEA4 TaxID=2996787 RepID=UPI00226D6681|nr:hypothetical protein [Nannocystis sp. SCPEA4]MCY1058127.1 hypothetical protein [Nannocystis sp. SCPEA4]